MSYDVLENTPSDMSLTDSFVVNDMLSAVDELSRRIIRLKAIEGVSFTAIAKETGMTPHNVKKVYSKGIAVPVSYTHLLAFLNPDVLPFLL